MAPEPQPAIVRGSPPRSVVVDVVLASAANALNQGDRVIMPIAAIPMARDLGWTRLQQGWVLSSFAYGYIVVQMPGGWISAHVPSSRLLFAAVLVWSVSTMLTPAAALTGFGVLFACRVCMGVAEGFCLPAIFQMFAERVPTDQRSRSFALMLGCGSLGMVAALLVCPLMESWSSMFTTFGALGLGWCAANLAVAAVRAGVRPPCAGVACCAPCHGRSSARGHQLAHAPAGYVGVELLEDSSDSQVTGAGEAEEPDPILSPSEQSAPQMLPAVDASTGGRGAKESPRPLLPTRDLCARLSKCAPLWAICVAHFSQNWTNSTLSNWLPTYLHDVLGMPTRSLSLTAVPFVVNAVTGVGAGHVADMLVARKVCSVLAVRRAATSIGLLGPAACHLLFTLTSSPGVAIAIVTLSFALGGTTSSGYMANHGDISDRFAGLTFGIANTAATLPGLVSGPFTAWMVSSEGASWTPVFVLAASINVAACGVYLILSKAHKVL